MFYLNVQNKETKPTKRDFTQTMKLTIPEIE